MKDIKEYHTKATDNLYELGVLFDQMVKFVHKIPEVLKQEQFNDVVDLLQEYFDLSNGLHEQFTNVINHWIDRAAEKLASSHLEEEAEGSGDNDSLDIPDLDLIGATGGASGGFERQGATNSQLTSDQPPNTDMLASDQTHDKVTQFSTADRQVPTDGQTHHVTGGGQNILGGTDTRGGGRILWGVKMQVGYKTLGGPLGNSLKTR